MCYSPIRMKISVSTLLDHLEHYSSDTVSHLAHFARDPVAKYGTSSHMQHDNTRHSYADQYCILYVPGGKNTADGRGVCAGR